MIQSLAQSATLRRMSAAAAALLLAGCNALAPVNPPIAKVDFDSGYRVNRLLKRQHEGVTNDPHTLFLLTFSGGGTRAAAFSYGVLEELRRTDVTVRGVRRNLLDEVDAISGVSGGSFTALAYALYGDRLFTEYEPRFLKRDVQGTLTWRALNPLNWFSLGSGLYGRSELAADYYDEILFNGATFADLLKLPTPVTAVTGTDLSTGARFQFSQEQFDLICSDLGTVRLARAAATSSAVPAVLSPVTYYNYGGHCGAAMPPWVQRRQQADTPSRPAGRALLRLRDIKSFEDSAEPALPARGRRRRLRQPGPARPARGPRGDRSQSRLPARGGLRVDPAHRGRGGQLALRAGHRLGPPGARAGHRRAAAAVVERADRPLLLRVGRTAEGHRPALGRQA